jgi:subtilisin family serine protease
MGQVFSLRMIHATASESYAVERGKPGVLVGIMDTGIDAAHPDIAPNFNARLSRNFTTDIPLIDGKCSKEPDKSCSDPATVDENSHGTHVAGTVASPINGFGMAGVAPGVTLVNRTGFRLFLPRADDPGHAVRGRHRDRRREHELLHGSVALQLRGRPPGHRPGDGRSG